MDLSNKDASSLYEEGLLDYGLVIMFEFPDRKANNLKQSSTVKESSKNVKLYWIQEWEVET